MTLVGLVRPQPVRTPWRRGGPGREASHCPNGWRRSWSLTCRMAYADTW